MLTEKRLSSPFFCLFCCVLSFEKQISQMIDSVKFIKKGVQILKSGDID